VTSAPAIRSMSESICAVKRKVRATRTKSGADKGKVVVGFSIGRDGLDAAAMQRLTGLRPTTLAAPVPAKGQNALNVIVVSVRWMSGMSKSFDDR
jgi:hypothetical protein